MQTKFEFLKGKTVVYKGIVTKQLPNGRVVKKRIYDILSRE